jgi:hypothetical protein
MEDMEYIRQAFPRYMERNPHDSVLDLETGIESGVVAPAVFRDEEGPCGFILFKVFKESLFVLSLYLERSYPYDVLIEYIERVAVRWGCERIFFRSIRPGWERRLEKYGFHREPVYEMSKEVVQ